MEMSYDGEVLDDMLRPVGGVTGLAAFRAENPRSPAAKKAKPPWVEPTPEDLPDTAFMVAIDASLAALGMVWIARSFGQTKVHRSITLPGDAAPGATGWEKDLTEFEDLTEKLASELSLTPSPGISWTAYPESPPLGGGVVHVESSLLGNAALRIAARQAGIPVGRMIRSQDWKRITINVPNAKKPVIKKLLMPFAERLGVQGLEKVTNESQRDALGVGLASMIRNAR